MEAAMIKVTKILFLTASIMLAITQSAYSSEYYSIKEYEDLHKEHSAVAAKFKEIVKIKGVPIKPGVQTKTVNIVFVYPGKQVSDYWRRSIVSFTRRMDELNIDYAISEYLTRANVELRIQEKQLRAALAEDPDYLVYTLNVLRHRNLIERILTRGRPKLILQNITTPVRDWEGIQPFLYVGFDHVIGATDYLAKHILGLTSGTGNYGLLYFDQGYISTMRGDSFVKYLNDHSDHKLVASYYTDGQRNKSKAAAMEMLEEHNVEFIYACSTDTAMGAIDALREAGKIGKVIINGWGGGSSELQAIMEGEMDYTVMRMNDDNGIAMAEAIKLDLENRVNEVPLIFSGDFAIVEKGIKEKDLKSLKMRAFRYSGVE